MDHNGASIALVPGGGFVMMLIYGASVVEQDEGTLTPCVALTRSGVMAFRQRLEECLEKIDEPLEE